LSRLINPKSQHQHQHLQHQRLTITNM